jgi:predicted  nucleic acid-binding Zn-ribbon protein
MPTCQYEGREYNVGDAFWANEADVCSNRCECKAIFVSTDPLKVEGAVDCQVESCTKCTHMGKSYGVGAFNDGCNDCICDEFGGVTCKTPSSSSGISPRNNPGCIHVNSECTHMGKRYPMGAFNDGCSDCICNEFGGVACKSPPSSSGITPRIIPGCIRVNSDEPLVASVDLGVNSRITGVSIGKNSGINFGPDLRINSSENSKESQILLPKVSADIIPAALLAEEEKEKCPLEQPSIGTPCSLPPGLECTYGEECCCGECSPSLVLSCFEGSQWGGFNTDFCFRAGGDSC